MIINVGSKNPNKIDAVKECIKNYDFLSVSEIHNLDVNSNVSEQPKTLEETINGAKNRAKSAFINCDLSFGIEDGLMIVPNTKTGYMNVCVCAIYDGKEFHLGLSSAYENPKKITEEIINNNLNTSLAYKKLGLTNHEYVGYDKSGTIGILTKGKLLRKEYTMQSITTALIHLENKDLF